MESEYLRKRREISLGIREPQPKKAREPIPKRSEKMKEVVKDLKRLYARFLKTRPFCRIKSPVCTKIATIVHHMKGRTPAMIMDEEFWCEACPMCNLYVEEHPQWAMEKGFKISRHAKP